MLANRYEPRHCLARDISKTGKWTACSPDKRTKRPDAARGTIGQHASMIKVPCPALGISESHIEFSEIIFGISEFPDAIISEGH